jgi:dihydroorotase
MVNRRQFLSAAVAAATVARVPNVFAAQKSKCDLLIKGGRVIDPSVRLDAVRDVAISGGRIAAVEPSIATAAAETIDARGKLVVPGLIDIHTHTGRSAEGPLMVLRDGVTGWIDAGSQGADGVDAIVAVARSSPQPARVLVNIGRGGILPGGDTSDLARTDVGAARDAIAKHRDFIAGVKARLSRDVVGTNDVEVLRRAQEVATSSPISSRRRPTPSSMTADTSCPRCLRHGAAASGSTSAMARPGTCDGTPSARS